MTDLVNEELEVTDHTTTQSVYLCTKWDPVSVYSCATRPNHLRLFFPISRFSGSNPPQLSEFLLTTGTQRLLEAHTHPFNGPFPGLPRWAGTRKVKTIWILVKQETVSGSGISRAGCKSAPRSRQITIPAPHYSVFYRPDALPVTQPTASNHWR